MKTRYFPYDAFLSHNQDDGSHHIRDELERLGARVWHDGYADITDRLVQGRITGGLADSRHICVCIGQSFRDSEWVRTEYRSGLTIERERKAERVVVVATDSTPAIPKELEGQRIFPLYVEGCEPLARFLIAGNARLSGPPVTSAEEQHVRTLLGLRSIMGSQTNLKLSLEERARLTKERLGYLLSQPDAESPAFDLGLLVYHLANGDRRFLGGYFMPDEHELRTVILDMFEALSRHPAVVRKLDSSVGRPDYDFLDPLIDLMRYPTEAARAVRVFEIMSALLDEAWRSNRVTRKDMAAFRLHAAQVRAGMPFAAAREKRNEKLRKSRR